LGRKEIIQFLNIESKINPDKYLTQKEITKGLKNLGFIFRNDYINRTLIKIRKEDIIEVEKSNSFRKKYKIKT
jgi:hypothetical protein